MLLNESCPDPIWIWRESISFISWFLPTITSMRHGWLVLPGKMLPLSWFTQRRKDAICSTIRAGKLSWQWSGSYALWISFATCVPRSGWCCFHWLYCPGKTPNCRTEPSRSVSTLGLGPEYWPSKGDQNHLLTLVSCNESSGRAGG